MGKISQKQIKLLQEKVDKAEDRKQAFLSYANKLEHEARGTMKELHLYMEDLPETVEEFVKMLVQKKVALRIRQIARNVSAIACDIPIDVQSGG